MKGILGFVQTILIGGFLFLLPLVLTVVLLQKAIEFGGKVLHPIAEKLPFDSVVGIKVRDLLAALALVAAAFLAGLLARAGVGARLAAKVEQLILRKVPGYTLLKGAVVGAGGSAGIEVALARFDDNTVLGFIVEKQDGGLLTVFVPSAPTPAVGTIFYLPEERVTRLDVPVADAMKVIVRLGVGSKELIERARANREGG